MLEDRNIEKKFYISPFFQPHESDHTVGAQELAELALNILIDVYDLTDSFDYNLVRLESINKNIRTKEKQIEELNEQLVLGVAYSSTAGSTGASFAGRSPLAFCSEIFFFTTLPPPRGRWTRVRRGGSQGRQAVSKG